MKDWRCAVQSMVLDMYSIDELVSSCPTVKGEKGSGSNRKALDPVRLETIYGKPAKFKLHIRYSVCRALGSLN